MAGRNKIRVVVRVLVWFHQLASATKISGIVLSTVVRGSISCNRCRLSDCLRRLVLKFAISILPTIFATRSS